MIETGTLSPRQQLESALANIRKQAEDFQRQYAEGQQKASEGQQMMGGAAANLKEVQGAEKALLFSLSLFPKQPEPEYAGENPNSFPLADANLV